MFEIYAVIASIFLPTGLISLVHFLCNIQLNNKKKLILWSLIIESIATISLGIFYMYCAIILSQRSVGSDVYFVNNIDDLAITNDTSHSEIEIPTFYNKNEEPIPSDQTNEVEDTRNSKPGPSAFLENYQYLVHSSVRKKLKNGTDEERTGHRRRLYHARNMEQPTMDILENQDCFLRAFFHQALLVHSFVTCVMSLLNTCYFCKQCPINDELPAIQEIQTENVSETFGEKILDNVSHDSSQNAAPVGPLFDEDSLGGAAPNLDVFNVKKSSGVDATERACAVNVKEEGLMFYAGKCLVMLTLPPVLVAALYFTMKSGDRSDAAPSDVDILANFNVTTSDIPTAHLAHAFSTDENGNGTHQKEINDILRRVYVVIDKFREEHKQSGNEPTVQGQYLYKLKTSNENFSETCLGDETNLKIFDFLVFVVLFFVVVHYAKLSAIKMSESISSRTLTKCVWVFVVLWTPSIVDIAVSMFITKKESNIFSGLLLLVGNMDRLYSTVQNVGSFKRYGQGGGFIKPAFN